MTDHTTPEQAGSPDAIRSVRNYAAELTDALSRLYFLPGDAQRFRIADSAGDYTRFVAPADAVAALRCMYEGGPALGLYLVSPDQRTRAAILDADSGDDLEARERDVALLQTTAKGLKDDYGFPDLLASVSGRKGYGLWFSIAEPVPSGDVVRFMVACRATYFADIGAHDLRPAQANTAGAATANMKLPPCAHPVSGKWSAFMPLDMLPDFIEHVYVPQAPDLHGQAALLNAHTSVPVDVFYKALEGMEAKHPPAKPSELKYIPVLDESVRYTPPCITALLEKGAIMGRHYNESALNLAKWFNATGQRDRLHVAAATMADNTPADHPTKKPREARIKSTLSNHGTDFACDYLVNGEAGQHFAAPGKSAWATCRGCSVRPAAMVDKDNERSTMAANPDEFKDLPVDDTYTPPGVGQPTGAPAQQTPTTLVEFATGMDAMVYALRTGAPVVNICNVWPLFYSGAYQKEDGQTAFKYRLPGLLIASRCEGLSAAEFFRQADLWASDSKNKAQVPGNYREAAQLFYGKLSKHAISDEAGAAALQRVRDFEARNVMARHARAALEAPYSVPANTLAMKLRSIADDTLKAGDTAGPLASMRSALFAAMGSTENSMVETPYPALNRLLGGGLRAGSLYVLLAPPKAGKTTFVGNLLDHAATSVPTLYCGFEMSRYQMLCYALARRLRINGAWIERRQFASPEQAAQVASGMDAYLTEVGAMLEVWEATPSTTIGDIAAWVIRAQAAHPGRIPVVCVDYLQLMMTGDRDIDGSPSDTRRVSAIAVGLKDLARRTGAVVIALSSATKAAEQQARDDGDIDETTARDSLAIVHAADGLFTLNTRPRIERKSLKGGDGMSQEIKTLDQWRVLCEEMRAQGRTDDATELERFLERNPGAYVEGGAPGYARRARLSLKRHRGQTGDVPLYYSGAYHLFEAPKLPGFAEDDPETRYKAFPDVFNRVAGSTPTRSSQNQNAALVSALEGVGEWSGIPEGAQSYETALNAVLEAPADIVSNSPPDLVQTGTRTGLLPNIKQAVPVRWYYTENYDDAVALITKLGDRPLGFDLETTGLDPLVDRAVLMQLCDGQTVVIVHLGKTGGLGRYADVLKARRLVAHNGLFEMSFMAAVGIDHTVDCTMIGEHIATGGMYADSDLGLGRIVQRRYGVELDKSKDLRTGWEGELSDEKLHYAALDAFYCRRLHQDQQAEITKAESMRAYQVVCDTQPAVVSMHQTGVFYDVVAADALVQRYEVERTEHEAHLAVALPGVNLASPAQIGAWLKTHLSDESLEKWPKTNSGALQTGADEVTANLALLPDDVATLMRDHFLRVRDLSKRIATMTDYRGRVGADGRIHPSLMLTAAVTGRMSCRHPNLQAVPRGGDVRRLFKAAPGKRLVLCDFGAIELRVAAHVVGAKGLLQAFEDGIDPHKQTAAMILGKAFQDVLPEDRKVAKGCNFGLLYGQGDKGLRDYVEGLTGVVLTLKQAAEYRKRWFETYPEFAEWHQTYSAKTKRALMARTVCGRERRWKASAEWKYTQALNLPVQGSAAEVMQISLARIHEGLIAAGLQSRLALVVHDEVLLEAPPAEVEQVKALVQEAMVYGMRAVFPDATDRLLADPEDCDSWADKG